VNRETRRVGAASFATGFGGAPTLAVNITFLLTLQASTVLAVAAAYDELDSPPGPAPGPRPDPRGQQRRPRASGVRRGCRQWHEEALGASERDSGNHKQVNKVVGRKILIKAREKSLTSFVKLVPAAGAAVGCTVDRGCTWLLGESASATTPAAEAKLLRDDPRVVLDLQAGPGRRNRGIRAVAVCNNEGRD
jgi:hypothetical protein